MWEIGRVSAMHCNKDSETLEIWLYNSLSIEQHEQGRRRDPWPCLGCRDMQNVSLQLITCGRPNSHAMSVHILPPNLGDTERIELGENPAHGEEKSVPRLDNPRYW